MGEACRKFETPVTGGNVSFYNQSTDDGPVFPTPTIGMLGVMDDLSNLMTSDFKQPGDLVYLIGESVNDIASSHTWLRIIKYRRHPAPYFDLIRKYDMHQVVKQLIRHKAHPVCT